MMLEARNPTVFIGNIYGNVMEARLAKFGAGQPIVEKTTYLAHFSIFNSMSGCGRGTKTGLSINPRRGGAILSNV